MDLADKTFAVQLTVIIALTEVFESTVPSKVVLPFCFEARISRKRKNNSLRNGSVKNFCPSNDNNWDIVRF